MQCLFTTLSVANGGARRLRVLLGPSDVRRRTWYRRRLEQAREESGKFRCGHGCVEIGRSAACHRRGHRLQSAVEAQRPDVRQREEVRPGRWVSIRAHPVRNHLLLSPRAEWNHKQRQLEYGLSRRRYERDWRRATPQPCFINGAAVPYSVAARAPPPIERLYLPLLTSPTVAAHRPRLYHPPWTPRTPRAPSRYS